MKIEAEKGLISLKEAAGLSGYSADYIGQLIRAGKIPGKQVACAVAWMTTAEAVLNYKNKGKENNQKPGLKERLANHGRQLRIEMDILMLFFKTFKHALPILAIIIALVSILVLYLLNTVLGTRIEKNIENRTGQILSY